MKIINEKYNLAVAIMRALNVFMVWAIAVSFFMLELWQ